MLMSLRNSCYCTSLTLQGGSKLPHSKAPFRRRSNAKTYAALGEPLGAPRYLDPRWMESFKSITEVFLNEQSH
jgi:hypothetical protein